MTEKSLHIFNPTCDMAVFSGNPYYIPPKQLKVFENELSYLMAFLADDGDCVKVNEMPDDAYMNTLALLTGFKPKFIAKGNIDVTGYFPKPWGLSPVIHKAFGKEWKPEYKELFSRHTGYNMLQYLDFKEVGLNPVVFEQLYSLEEVFDLLERWRKIVVKSPWSSSGRGVVFLSSPEDKTGIQWIDGFIRSQGSVYVEPMYAKKQDFSLLFEKKGEDISYCGLTYFFTSDGKQYEGHVIGNIENAVEKGLVDACISEKKEKELARIYKDAIRKTNLSDYEGYLGIDALITEDDEGEKIIPFCELNIRTTMGVLALHISEFLEKNESGVFRIKKEQDAYNTQLKREKNNPPEMQGNKITKGVFSLIPLSGGNQFNAWIEV